MTSSLNGRPASSDRDDSKELDSPQLEGKQSLTATSPTEIPMPKKGMAETFRPHGPAPESTNTISDIPIGIDTVGAENGHSSRRLQLGRPADEAA